MTNGEKSVNPLRDEASPLLSGKNNNGWTIKVPSRKQILFFQTPLDRRGMASLAILASLGSLHVDAFGHVGIV